ncbi:hypothetical protein HWV62_1046 [Athelia sp. TMB]|nr:hypothetical protein HWV62_1046 [Athelia sp. TMB]
MVHATKRLYQAASRLAIAPSALPQFPPREALQLPAAAKPRPGPSFDPALWASLQPPPKAALAAFAHRIGLGAVLPAPELQQACMHPSFLPLHAKHYPSAQAPPSNAQLATAGNALMGLFASEHLHATYPHLPLRVLKAAREQVATPTRPAVMHTDALASVPRALTALVYTHRSLPAARKFVSAFFLARDADLRALIKFANPKKALLETVAKFGRERPRSRLLRETGRHSLSPVFVVGIYSGPDQLGEGFGSSLRMAEYRAAEDALHRVYLTRTPAHLLTLPSSTFPATGSIYSSPSSSPAFTPSAEATIIDVDADSVELADDGYTPGALGEAEVRYASSGRGVAVDA